MTFLTQLCLECCSLQMMQSVNTSIPSITDCLKLQEDLNSLSLWNSTWSLHFNLQKCLVLSFHPSHSEAKFNHQYYVDSTTLQIKFTHRDLGVVKSENLRWSEHYQSMLVKAYKLLCLIRRVFASRYCPLAKKVLYRFDPRSLIVLPFGVPISLLTGLLKAYGDEQLNLSSMTFTQVTATV